MKMLFFRHFNSLRASRVAVEDALLKGRVRGTRPAEEAARGRGGCTDDIGDNLPPQDEALDKARGLIVNSGLSG